MELQLLAMLTLQSPPIWVHAVDIVQACMSVFSQIVLKSQIVQILVVTTNGWTALPANVSTPGGRYTQPKVHDCQYHKFSLFGEMAQCRRYAPPPWTEWKDKDGGELVQWWTYTSTAGLANPHPGARWKKSWKKLLVWVDPPLCCNWGWTAYKS